jgi:hypothetical protein
MIEGISSEFPVGNIFHLSDAYSQESSWHRDRSPWVVMAESARNGKR